MELKLRFLEDQVEEKLIDVLQCLRDSSVLVPFQQGMMPALVKNNEGTLFLPMFSRPEEVPVDYGETVILRSMKAVSCVKLAHELKNVEGLILDCFSKQVNLAFNVADIIPRMDSMLME